jgi:YfiH family protein
MPAVKFSARLDLEQIIRFVDGHKLGAAVHWVQDRGLIYAQFPKLSGLEGFFHGVFLRRKIDPGNPIEDFNLGMGCGTPDAQVRANRRRMLGLFGQGVVGVYARQVHGTRVGIWNSKPLPAQNTRLDGDALITNRPSGALVIQTADCQAVVIIDPVRRVVANIHSGWRGSVGNIIGHTIRSMIAEYGCRPRDMVCGIGPSLGPCCAEFVNYRNELPKSFWNFRRAGDYFDFWEISRHQMQAAGISGDHISVSGICTKCNPHLFFSYRGDPRCGRFATVVGICNGGGHKI